MSSRGVLASVRRVGHAVWTERRMFEVLGSWVRDTAEPEVKVALATQSRHHAWRADQLATLLSTFAGTDASQLTVAPDGSVDDALGACADAVTAERLAVVLDLTGRLVVEYEALRAGASEVADGPAVRILSIVVDDLQRDRRGVDVLLAED